MPGESERNDSAERLALFSARNRYRAELGAIAAQAAREAAQTVPNDEAHKAEFKVLEIKIQDRMAREDGYASIHDLRQRAGYPPLTGAEKAAAG